MPNKPILVLYLLAWGMAMGLPFLYAMNYYGIGYLKVNMTPSIAKGLYWVEPGAPVGKGDDVAFYYQGPFFEKGVELLKHCVGREGDVIERSRSDQVFINGWATPAMLKPISLQGEPLQPGPLGTVPKDAVFVLGDHKDSFDSRYAYVGFVQQNQIVGKATKLIGWSF